MCNITKLIKWCFSVRRCDNCGKINPRKYANNSRLCGESKCKDYKGFYKLKGEPLGTNGKVGRWTIQFPISISWCGWWTLYRK